MLGRLKLFIPILIVVAIAFFLRVYQVDKIPPGLYDDECRIDVLSIGPLIIEVLTLVSIVAIVISWCRGHPVVPFPAMRFRITHIVVLLGS